MCWLPAAPMAQVTASRGGMTGNGRGEAERRGGSGLQLWSVREQPLQQEAGSHCCLSSASEQAQGAGQRPPGSLSPPRHRRQKQGNSESCVKSMFLQSQCGSPALSCFLSQSPCPAPSPVSTALQSPRKRAPGTAAPRRPVCRGPERLTLRNRQRSAITSPSRSLARVCCVRGAACNHLGKCREIPQHPAFPASSVCQFS